MLREFNIAEKGAGSYWPLAILRWVMVLIFVSFGIQKFTPQSAHGIAVYIANSPLVSWLQILGIRGEAYLLGCIELTTAVLLAAGAFAPLMSALGSLMGVGHHYMVVFLHHPRGRDMESLHRSHGVEPCRRVSLQGHRAP